MQASCIRKHSTQDVHKTALQAYLQPTKPVSVWIDSDTSSRLMQGSVPQLSHWLRTWRCLREATSYRVAEALQSTEEFLAKGRGDPCRNGTTRKAVKSMSRIHEEVIRERKQAELLKASSVTVSVDDRGAFRLVKYRVDHLSDDSQSGRWGSGVSSAGSSEAKPLYVGRSGLLAVVTHRPKEAVLEDIDNDYSLEMKNSIIRAVKRVCTPLGSGVDEQAVNHILRKVRTFTADGAASVQKCAKILKSNECPNVALSMRDPAHAVKIATQEPVKHHDNFEEFWASIFDERHALLPDIENSDAWKSKLMLAQKYVLRLRGTQGAGLKVALRTLSFAKQRFDSAASPARKYCCLIVAIAILLAVLAGDTRMKVDIRARANKLLSQMTPKHIVTAGLFADYCAETLRFTRLFDVNDHDIATLSRSKAVFLRRMHVLFSEAHVMRIVPPLTGGETFTSIAIGQAKAAGVIYFADRAINLWPEKAETESRAAVAAMALVVQCMRERVEAEFHKDSLAMDFAAFDIPTWNTAMDLVERGMRAEGEAIQRKQRDHAWRLVQAHTGLVNLMLVLDEFCSAAKDIRNAARKKGRRSEWEDNRLLWGRKAAMPCCSSELSLLIRWYISIQDVTGPLERALSILMRILQQHLGGNHADPSETAELLTTCLSVHLDGPHEEGALAEIVPMGPDLPAPANFKPLDSSVPDGLRMTPYTQRCAELWLQHHGRRFAVYRTNRPRCTRLPKRGTDASVVRGHTKAMNALEDSAHKCDGKEPTVLGQSRRDLLKQTRPAMSCAMQRFRALSRKKVELARKQKQLRKSGANCYPAGAMRLGNLFSQSADAGVPLVRASSGAGVMQCVTALTNLPVKDYCRVQTVSSDASKAMSAIAKCDLVIVEDAFER